MPDTLLRIVLVSALVMACSPADASTRAAKSGDSPSAATTRTASGIVDGTALRDTISDRADLGRIMGNASAPVWLIMASDFQCPFCKQWHDAQFAGIVKDYVTTGRVRLAYLNYPLGQHQFAVPAAEAAMCAAVQNKFWPLHDALFATQAKWEALPNPTQMFDSLAAAAGVKSIPYRACVNKHLTLPLIEADRDRAKQAGAQSTPTFFVGNEVFMGADKDIRAALDAALAKAGSAKKPTN